MTEPKIASVSLATGQKVYWCPRQGRQIPEIVCREKYFVRGKACRKCLGIAKGKHWPEPWASIGKMETIEVGERI